jgi:hypothetical protein
VPPYTSTSLSACGDFRPTGSLGQICGNCGDIRSNH